MELHGIIPPMVTPTTGRTGDVDVEALADYTDFLLDNGVHGLFPCGSTGEFASLTPSQRTTVVETVADRADGVPVVAGCGDTSVEGVLAHIDAADTAGADAAVVVTPYYLTTDQAGLRAFFETVADESSLPVVLYNIPSLTGQPLSVDTVVGLAEHPDIVGLKDSTFDLTYHYGAISSTPDQFTVLQGTSHLSLAALGMGAAGATAGVSNVFPSVLCEIYDASRAGDHDRATRLMNDVVHPVIDATSSVSTAAALKHLLGLAGHDVGEPLVPLSPLSAEERTSLEACYQRVTDRL